MPDATPNGVAPTAGLAYCAGMEDLPGADALVTIRRRWDDPRSSRIARGYLKELRLRNDPGGVCSDFPRAFLSARVWCDQLAQHAGWHACQPATAPHELEVVVLEADNGALLFAQLSARRGG